MKCQTWLSGALTTALSTTEVEVGMVEDMVTWRIGVCFSALAYFLDCFGLVGCWLAGGRWDTTSQSGDGGAGEFLAIEGGMELLRREITKVGGSGGLLPSSAKAGGGCSNDDVKLGGRVMVMAFSPLESWMVAARKLAAGQKKVKVLVLD